MREEQVEADELVRQAQSILDAQGDAEVVVQLFHDAGISKSTAIRLFAQSTGRSRRDAIHIVHHSRAYEAQKDVDEAIQADVLNYLSSIGDPGPEDAE